MVLRYRYWEYAAAYKICEYHLRSRAFILMHHDSHYTPSCMTFGLNLLCHGALGNLTIKTNDAVVHSHDLVGLYGKYSSAIKPFKNKEVQFVEKKPFVL